MNVSEIVSLLLLVYVATVLCTALAYLTVLVSSPAWRAMKFKRIAAKAARRLAALEVRC